MRARATSTVLAAMALCAGLTGCAFTAEQATQQPYDPSDGLSAVVGDVQIENAILISEDGDRGNLIASIINESDQNVALTVSWESASGERADRNVYLRAGASRTIGTDANPMVLGSIEAPPGSLFPVYFQYEDYEGRVIPGPVLTDALDEYSDLLPAEVIE